MKRGAVGIHLPDRRLLFSLLVSNALSVALFFIRIIGSGTTRFSFLPWNLFLAWLPLLISTWLVWHAGRKGWLNWQGVVGTLLWLGFLPNSFYMLTDLVHLQSSGEINILFDTVLVVSYIFNGLVVGYLSLYQVHRALLKRLSAKRAHLTIWAVLLGVGFAIYLGRSLRWNTWDLLLHPSGLLFDVSDRIVHPVSYPEAFLTTTTFWLLMSAMYYVVWQFLQIAHDPTASKTKQ